MASFKTLTKVPLDISKDVIDCIERYNESVSLQNMCEQCDEVNEQLDAIEAKLNDMDDYVGISLMHRVKEHMNAMHLRYTEQRIVILNPKDIDSARIATELLLGKYIYFTKHKYVLRLDAILRYIGKSVLFTGPGISETGFITPVLYGIDSIRGLTELIDISNINELSSLKVTTFQDLEKWVLTHRVDDIELFYELFEKKFDYSKSISSFMNAP